MTERTGHLLSILYTVEYKQNWQKRIGKMDDGHYFQWRITVGNTTWGGRKWYVSPHATDSEFLQTVLMAALAAEEHEAREAFKVSGRAIYGPHIDANKLWDLADGTHEDARQHIELGMEQQ